MANIFKQYLIYDSYSNVKNGSIDGWMDEWAFPRFLLFNGCLLLQWIVLPFYST